MKRNFSLTYAKVKEIAKYVGITVTTIAFFALVYFMMWALNDLGFTM